MKLTQGIKIDENIITASIAVSELGNATIEASVELNQLHNFVRSIEYSQIDFSSNMKLINNMPVVTDDEADGIQVEEVSIDLINKKHIIDENLSVELVIDIGKIPVAEYTTNKVFNTPELLGQARAVLFIEKIKATVSEKLAEIRAMSSDIENETDVVL